MMNLKSACVPRSSVFDQSKRDTVLDLTDLMEDRIDARQFFAENHVTEGMRVLLEQAFRRFEGKSDQGTFLLKQAMGGGKTHNLLALGLLAKHPELREQVMGAFYKPSRELGEVKVVAFTGRQSDAPLGIWGEIATQLGRKDHFKDCYSPLQAPGQTAWINLLKGERILILLDELPPYFEHARAKSVGDSNLAKVTETALSNLLVAISKSECANVCLVITDLEAAYGQGSASIGKVMANLKAEAGRLAMPLEPVRMSSDEFYQILRTRLFEKLTDERQIQEIAQSYAKAVRDAKQMAVTNESPEQFAQRVVSSYPFHPSIRDLFARFRENQGFQQTRGMIRLMRIVVSRMWNSCIAERKSLIAAHDLDLNDADTLAELDQINSTLKNAIAHDIADGGSAVAERMDANLGAADATDAVKLIFMSSLANVPNAVIGLTIPEIIAYLAEPGRDIARLKSEVLEKLATSAWYLHANRDGKLFFKNVENLIAKLETLVKGYIAEQALKELKTRLQKLFAPESSWCYQKVEALPGVDDIELDQDKVALVIFEPTPGQGLHPDLQRFYEQATWKNRVLFLAGSRETTESFIESGKRLKAIQHILEEMEKEKVSESDPQRKAANELRDKIDLQFYSAVRETFTQLWYPTKNGLACAEFRMNFEGNRYRGEDQVIKVLEEKQKFTKDITGDVFRQKCEDRLFTTQHMPWSEIKKRGGSNPLWPWHRTDALEALKRDCILKDIWREEGEYINKGPFPKEATTVLISPLSRDDDTGEVTLRLTPQHGDTIFAEVGAPATTASEKLSGSTCTTKELKVSFLAVDSTKQHEPGPPVAWQNTITLKHAISGAGDTRQIELRAAPHAEIRYTTDGSDPKVCGAIYDGPFEIQRGTSIILAYAERDGIRSEVRRIDLDWKAPEGFQIDDSRPAVLERRAEITTTREVFEFLKVLKEHGAEVSKGTRISIVEGRNWVDLSLADEIRSSPESLEASINHLRTLLADGEVNLSFGRTHFPTGRRLKEWLVATRSTVKPGEVKQ